MSVTSDSSDIADASNVPWPTPSRSTVIRSAMSSTSGSRWLTYAMPTPLRLCSNTSWWSRSTSAGPSAVVGSSSSSTRGRASSALTTSSSCRSASESAAAGASGGQVELERRELLRRPALHRAERRLAARRPPRETDSARRSVRARASTSGRRCRDRAAVPRRKTRGEAGGRRSRPFPRPERTKPLAIPSSVDFPEPFSPTSAWISPARQSKSTSRSACTAPNAFDTPRKESTTGASRARDRHR